MCGCSSPKTSRPAIRLRRERPKQNGRYSFTNLAAPEDFIVAVYASETSATALDSELDQTEPSNEVTLPDFEIPERLVPGGGSR